MGRNSNSLKIACSAIAALIFSSCVQTFAPPATMTSYNFLVIDGFINAGNDSTLIKLSRSGVLSDTTQIQPETHASVLIEGNNGTTIPLYEISPGSYSCGPFYPFGNIQYRIRVATTNGSQYASDYVTPMFAPPIDSISWANTSVDEAGQSGVTIYVNAHDNNSGTQYYRWIYTETWEFHPFFESVWGDQFYLNKIGLPASDYKTLYTCWNTVTSTNILLGSAADLSKNIISGIPIEFLPDSSWKLSVEYSIMVQQQAIDENTYSFFQILQKNSEQLGSLFAPEPSTGSNGNIHCLNNPSEVVIGYIYSSSTTSQRIFIKNSQVPDWYQAPNSCIQWMAIGIDDSAIDLGESVGSELKYITSPPCGVCTLSGTNVEPSFWPN